MSYKLGYKFLPLIEIWQTAAVRPTWPIVISPNGAHCCKAVGSRELQFFVVPDKLIVYWFDVTPPEESRWTHNAAPFDSEPLKYLELRIDVIRMDSHVGTQIHT